MSEFFHNSHESGFRDPFGAVVVGNPTKLVIDAFANNVSKAFLQIKFVDIDNKTEEFEIEMNRSSDHSFEGYCPNDKAGVWFYRFKFLTGQDSSEVYYGNNNEHLGGVGEQGSEEYYQITVTEKNLKVPKWFKKAIIYQIFPDRFAKGYDALAEDKKNAFYYSDWNDLPFYVRKPNSTEIARWDFHRGNLSGISEKLPYIEAIGANLIYLNPIFSARSNHRYDTADYMKVDGLLGGDPAFELLCYAAGKDNIKIMLDGVFSHTGADSIYFDKEGNYGGVGAYQNQNSKYRSWYNFKSEDDNEYEAWWDVKDLPNVNELDSKYLDFICDGDDSVIKHWIKKGVSGWRLDVADELPDEFIRHIAAAAEDAGDEEGTEPVILGEVWEDASNKVSYAKLRSYFTAKELTTVTNYPFRKNLLAFFAGEKTGKDIKNTFLSMQENYPKANFNVLVNMTGTHDVRRLMTEMLEIAQGDRKKARNLVKAYAAVMFAFPGIPLVYYGDETCLEGETDPDNRRTFPWGKEDINMITYFANMAKMRRENEVFSQGDTKFIDCEENCFGFVRQILTASPANLFGSSSAAKTENILFFVSNKPYESEKVKLSGLLPNTKYVSIVTEDFEIITDGAGNAEAEICGAEVMKVDN